MSEKEKKNTRTRRSLSSENSGRQQDQVLSGAVDAPRIGKIAGPKKTSEKSGQRSRKKSENKQPETKRTDGKKAESKKAAEKSQGLVGKKKTENGHKTAGAKGGRKGQKPAISQTAAQVEAMKAQQEAQEKRAS